MKLRPLLSATEYFSFRGSGLMNQRISAHTYKHAIKFLHKLMQFCSNLIQNVAGDILNQNDAMNEVTKTNGAHPLAVVNRSQLIGVASNRVQCVRQKINEKKI